MITGLLVISTKMWLSRINLVKILLILHVNNKISGHNQSSHYKSPPQKHAAISANLQNSLLILYTRQFTSVQVT
jgi:hypothetical protein